MPNTLEDLISKREELNRQQQALEQEIANARQAQRQGAIDQVRKIMSENGLTLADLGQSKAPREKLGKLAGRKVAPKYRDPSTGKTWSGRGIKPSWMMEAIAAGKTADDFLI